MLAQRVTLGKGWVDGGGGAEILFLGPQGLRLIATTPFPLHRLQQQHPAFSGVARLAKRWVRAQLLGEGFTDESLDLVVAALFLHPEPFTPPR